MAEKGTRTVVITGSSEGIGREAAFRFSREGWNVVLTYHKDEKEGIEAKAKCAALGASSTSLLQLDLSDPSSIRKAVDGIKGGFRQGHDTGQQRRDRCLETVEGPDAGGDLPPGAYQSGRPDNYDHGDAPAGRGYDPERG